MDEGNRPLRAAVASGEASSSPSAGLLDRVELAVGVVALALLRRGLEGDQEAGQVPDRGRDGQHLLGVGGVAGARVRRGRARAPRRANHGRGQEPAPGDGTGGNGVSYTASHGGGVVGRGNGMDGRPPLPCWVGLPWWPRMLWAQGRCLHASLAGPRADRSRFTRSAVCGEWRRNRCSGGRGGGRRGSR
jgi:hypothetical protein